MTHPTHSAGRVERIAVQDISGFSPEFILVVFDEARMILRVPSNKACTIGLRRIVSQALIDEALAILKGRPKPSKVMWARRVQEYQAKINSGDPRIIAEVVWDLNGNAISGTQSFSERAIYETAVDRLAGEIARPRVGLKPMPAEPGGLLHRAQKLSDKEGLFA